LITAGKEGETVRIGLAYRAQALCEHIERLFPGDFLEPALAAFATRYPPQRTLQLSRRLLLHDAGGNFCAEHAFVDRMVPIPFDKANLFVL
jgi:hypothetical protein